jgi:hypothetical protein
MILLTMGILGNQRKAGIVEHPVEAKPQTRRFSVSVMHAVTARIDAVGDSYGAIDIRCVAIRDGKSWLNGMVKLR